MGAQGRLLLCGVLVLGALGTAAKPVSADTAPVAAVRLPPEIPRPVRLWSSGPEVMTAQRKLGDLGFHVGRRTGDYDYTTQMAVWAFQKANGIAPTNRIDRRTWTALEHPRKIRPLVRKAPRNRVEINLKRQLLVLWEKGQPRLVSHISTGAGRRYCAAGRCRVAVTPRGSFQVRQRDKGWRVGHLGAMFSPLYFNGGIAMHGSLSVPRYPASHGCVRVPLPYAKFLYRNAAVGLPVYVGKS